MCHALPRIQGQGLRHPGLLPLLGQLLVEEGGGGRGRDLVSLPQGQLCALGQDESFQLQATYGDDPALPAGTDKVIGQFEVAKGGAGSEPEGKSKLKVQIRLNLHGLVEVESVHSVKEETYEVEVIPEKPAEKPKAMEVEGEAEGWGRRGQGLGTERNRHEGG